MSAADDRCCSMGTNFTADVVHCMARHRCMDGIVLRMYVRSYPEADDGEQALA